MRRSCVTDLGKGRIENPGYEKMRTTSRAMGFPPALWFEDAPADGAPVEPVQGRDIAARVEPPVRDDTAPQDRRALDERRGGTHEHGRSHRGDAEGIRSGKITDPMVGQGAALAAAFGVPPSNLAVRGTDPSVIDEETLDAHSDETAGAIPREKRIVLGKVLRFVGRTE